MAEEEITDQHFSKIIVSKYSLENKCNVKEGEALTIIPKTKLLPKDHIKHYFVSIIDLKTKSQYGWVKEVSKFTLKDFIGTHYGAKELKDEEKEHIEIMLESISNFKEGIPVAATYSQKGFMDKRMVLKVHKVILHDIDPI